jgi:translocation and assembly module TamB
MAALEANVRGALQSPQVTGRVQIENAAASIANFPNGMSNVRGVLIFTGDRATIESLTGETGGGQLRLTGFAGYAEGQPVFRINAETKAVRLRYPEGISTVSNAELTFTGTAERSTVAGTVSVLRGSLNLQSDFGSLLAKSAEPVRTPAANTGFLGGMNLDIQIQTAPDAEIESSLTQGVQADANLRLRGTATNPALQGRVNITQGQVLFFGTKYTIGQGSVSFFDPLKIEPVLNIDLDTRVRGIDVTMTVAGPLDKLTLSPRSDPPLQFSEIVSLLATGSSPTTDTGLRVQQSAVPQQVQQSAATALLGQVIASPVTGRLQRFFGLSGIRIDPTLPGIEYGAQARVTLQQQVTPDVTFTYITNVSQANPQVVSVEWAINKQWSVVTQREENGMLGLDFFYKRRFK